MVVGAPVACHEVTRPVVEQRRVVVIASHVVVAAVARLEVALACVWVQGIFVVVAGQGVQASKTRRVIARAVVGVGRRIVVARRRVRAASHWEHAVAGIVRGIRVVVQGRFVGAAQDFIHITDAVHVQVDTRAVAVEARGGENARPRLGRILVEVASQ